MTSNSLARRRRRQAAAVAVIVLAFCHRLPAAPLTLEAALDRVIASHPDLRTFGPRAQVLENEALLAALPRENTLGLVVENAVGAGDLRGFDAAETTLTLAGVLERGGKREARRAMAAARLDELGVERAGVQFDILAETARRYLEVVAWQARQPLAEEQLAQRERMADAARQRFTQGAAPEAAALRAEADVAEARAALAGARIAAEVASRRLALMWGETAPAAIEVVAPPQELPALPDFPEFRKRLPAAPELARFATTERIRDARVRLAASARTADLEWQLGVRHFAASGDLALVGGVSMALGAARRGRLEESSARAELASLELERRSVEMQLEAALLEAWSQAGAAAMRVRTAEQEVLPRLRRAADNAEKAYRAGALGYLEWAEIRNAIDATRGASLDARLDWRRAMIEIQRLTAEPVVGAR
jgi:cobalt-zinc-cadmium efflux system outer membrane protein